MLACRFYKIYKHFLAYQIQELAQNDALTIWRSHVSPCHSSHCSPSPWTFIYKTQDCHLIKLKFVKPCWIETVKHVRWPFTCRRRRSLIPEKILSHKTTLILVLMWDYFSAVYRKDTKFLVTTWCRRSRNGLGSYTQI